MDELIREMIAPRRLSDLDRGRRSRLIATALTVALAAVGLTSLATGALFTDTEPVSASDFQTGTVDIAADHSATQPLGAPNMAPGDVVYGVVPVANQGSLELRYAVQVTSTNAQPADLAGQLQLAVYEGAPTCDAAGVASATSIAAMAGVGTGPTTIIGDTAVGQQAGDRVLAAGAGEDLCISVGLPIGTDDTFQDTHAEVALTFVAEQTVNN